jgi:hypothetical protein
MEFTCHSISNGDPYNSSTVGWVVVGNGKLFVAPTKEEVLKDVRAQFPDAEYEDCWSVEAWQVPVLLLGKKGLLHWYRCGCPPFDMVNGLPTWPGLEGLK